MKFKLDRDESLLYFIQMDSPVMAARWIVDLTQEEFDDFRRCEREYFDWQNKFEDKIRAVAP